MKKKTHGLFGLCFRDLYYPVMCCPRVDPFCRNEAGSLGIEDGEKKETTK